MVLLSGAGATDAAMATQQQGTKKTVSYKRTKKVSAANASARAVRREEAVAPRRGGARSKYPNKGGEEKMRRSIICASIVAVFVILTIFGSPTMANWNYDGYPLSTSSSGTVYGDVYLSDGDNHNAGFDEIYVTNFSVPDGTTHLARLYVSVWGMNEYNTGWVNTTFNGHTYTPVFINGTNDNNPTVWGAGHGVWWIYYDVTNNVTPGVSNQAVVRRTLGDRILRVILVSAYNDTDGCGTITYYWINDGNVNLHYNYSTGYDWDLDSTTTRFNGTIDEISSAELFTTHYGGGNAWGGAEPDFLYFNALEAYHRPNQLGDDGNETWGDDDIAENLFDMLAFDVTTLVETSGNNATFWRGHDDNGDGWIYHNASVAELEGAEGEAYVHPILAVLTVNSKKQYLIRDFKAGVANIFSIPTLDSEPISTALSSIAPYYTYVNRYNSTTQTWQVYNKDMPFPPMSQFTTIDPGVGYQVAPTSACTLSWITPSS